MVQTRSKKSLKNIAFVFGGYFINLLLQLINRLLFVNYLSQEYLGINGLFSNILSMLALSELGIGAAIIYALYEPIAKKDIEKVKSLMLLYKKMYTAIGCFILVVGIAITPFVDFFIKEKPDIPYLKFYFLLYVLNSGISYFYTYKRSIIICNQEEYISTITTTLASFFTKGAQIAVLVLTRNFTLFLVIQILFTRLENIVISKIADKKFPYLKDNDVKPLSNDEKKKIKNNVFAMMLHKIGEVIVNSTDSIILSKMLGIIPVGLMSNYMMIFDAISSLTNKVFNSITASIGNLVVNESKEHSEQIFYNILFANFWFISLCTVCLFTCMQTFVGLWLGKDYVLSIDVLIALCGCFYFSGMRRSALQFRSALGLFWYDRYKPVVESILNIVVSIVFIKLIGMAGVKFGTIVSTILTSFWIEGYILYKHYFDKSVKIYFAKQLLYFLLMIFECYFLYFLFGYLKFDSLLFELFVRGIISFFVVNLLYLLLFKNRKEFKYFTGLFIRKNK